MSHPGEQRAQLTDAICVAFEDDFELWLTEAFDTDVRTSIAPGALRQRVVTLIRYHEARGEEQELLRRLAVKRGNNPLVRGYLQTHAPHIIADAKRLSSISSATQTDS